MTYTMEIWNKDFEEPRRVEFPTYSKRDAEREFEGICTEISQHRAAGDPQFATLWPESAPVNGTRGFLIETFNVVKVTMVGPDLNLERAEF